MIEEAAISDDFTFPTITENNSSPYHLHFPSFATSSLWYVSSTVSDLSDAKQLPKESEFSFEQKTLQRRSFSSVEGGQRVDNLTRELAFSQAQHANFNGESEKSRLHGDEEKMDMLWEDFNDEPPSRPSGDKGEKERPKKRFSDSEIRYESDMGGRGMADLCYVQTLKMSKSRSLMHHRRPGLLIILKALKKLFLVHNSHCPTKKTSTASY